MLHWRYKNGHHSVNLWVKLANTLNCLICPSEAPGTLPMICVFCFSILHTPIQKDYVQDTKYASKL